MYRSPIGSEDVVVSFHVSVRASFSGILVHARAPALVEIERTHPLVKLLDCVLPSIVWPSWFVIALLMSGIDV